MKTFILVSLMMINNPVMGKSKVKGKCYITTTKKSGSYSYTYRLNRDDCIKEAKTFCEPDAVVYAEFSGLPANGVDTVICDNRHDK